MEPIGGLDNLNIEANISFSDILILNCMDCKHHLIFPIENYKEPKHHVIIENFQ